MMEIEKIYRPEGVCSSQIRISVCDGIIDEVTFVGGCNGNAQGIGRLIKGMPIEEAIGRLEGICCGNKQTSCPDQLSKALKGFL